jgi:hypothetical protein
VETIAIMAAARHQAIAPDLHACPLCCLGEQIAVRRIIAVLEKGLFAAVAALRHVVRDAWEDDAWEASHDAS